MSNTATLPLTPVSAAYSPIDAQPVGLIKCKAVSA